MHKPPSNWQNYALQIKKLEKQLSVREDEKKRLLLANLQQQLGELGA